MILKLTTPIIEDIKKGNLKAVKLINFLLSSGFTSLKAPFISSLKDLHLNNKHIKNAVICQNKYNLILKF
tara:strand:- start:389 stop:598 length:210 start_codon:yes stop_codon:yes gene_type:complete